MAGDSEERHKKAWERFMAAERREVEERRQGHLAKALGVPILPGETKAELARLGEEDRALAERGLVQLMNLAGEVRHKHVDELTFEDRADRARAHGARVLWLTERSKKLLDERDRQG